MTLGDIATTARFYTNTDTSSYTDAQLLININIWYQKIVSIIFESQDDTDFDDARRTDYPIQTTPMVANQRDYAMAVTEAVLKIKRVDMTYDGSHWYRGTAKDSSEYGFGIGFDQASSTDTVFDQHFIQQAPVYDVSYNSIFIAPMPTATDVANGGTIRVEWERNVIPFTTADYTSVLTDSTVVPGFDAPFHPMLAAGAAFEYASARQLPQFAQLQQELQDWEVRVRQAYGRKELDTRLQFRPSYQNYS